MYIGIRRKASKISGICLFLVTHLNHELTQAAYELRVWLMHARSAENPFEPPQGRLKWHAIINYYWFPQIVFISFHISLMFNWSGTFSRCTGISKK